MARTSKIGTCWKPNYFFFSFPNRTFGFWTITVIWFLYCKTISISGHTAGDRALQVRVLTPAGLPLRGLEQHGHTVCQRVHVVPTSPHHRTAANVWEENNPGNNHRRKGQKKKWHFGTFYQQQGKTRDTSLQSAIQSSLDMGPQWN